MTYTFDDILEFTKNVPVERIVNFYNNEKKKLDKDYEIDNDGEYWTDAEGNINNYFHGAIINENVDPCIPCSVNYEYTYYLKDEQVTPIEFRMMAPHYLYFFEKILK